MVPSWQSGSHSEPAAHHPTPPGAGEPSYPGSRQRRSGRLDVARSGSIWSGALWHQGGRRWGASVEDHDACRSVHPACQWHGGQSPPQRSSGTTCLVSRRSVPARPPSTAFTNSTALVAMTRSGASSEVSGTETQVADHCWHCLSHWHGTRCCVTAHQPCWTRLPVNGCDGQPSLQRSRQLILVASARRWRNLWLKMPRHRGHRLAFSRAQFARSGFVRS